MNKDLFETMKHDSFFPHHLTATGNEEEWGAGDSGDEQLPPPPANIQVKPDNGRITISWDPVPGALYYNLYFLTSKGVHIKPSDLTRPIASPDDFQPVLGVTKEKGNCIEGAASPYLHQDLGNSLCYHYIVTAITPEGESPESKEIMAIPSPYLTVFQFGSEGMDDGEFKSPTGIACGQGWEYLRRRYGQSFNSKI